MQVGEDGSEDDKRCYATHQRDREEVACYSGSGEGAAHQPPYARDDIRYEAPLAEHLGDPDPAEDDDPEDGEDPACTARDRRHDRLCRHTGEEAEEDRCPDQGEERREAVPERRDGDHQEAEGEGDEGIHQSRSGGLRYDERSRCSWLHASAILAPAISW